MFDSWFNNATAANQLNNVGRMKEETKIDNSCNSSNNATKVDNANEKIRILRIVTSLHYYEDGGRGTTKRSDRLQKMIIPGLV